ncbi:tRNA pseudouridine(55) synthase TruB [Hippea alviniae]|uniref:tRNA pseudouridine(55) synthase TruB n=1 Tax=Hippea alviniae TaxID=1279027 RepID=UPI0003B6683C|nr:tRNA pseudouridine(55) synthase TruB [Hippea alviniae]
MNSIVLVDKPADITSFDVIRILRKRLKIKKIGHAGVLDKMATGLLVCATGRATKLLSIFENSYKVYVAEITLGLKTDTYDITGRVVERFKVDLDKDKIKGVLAEFVGEIEQLPPPFSNVKYKGKRLYKYALKGESVDIKPRKVKIYGIKLLDIDENRLTIEVKCSKGTYIRTLANDIGERLKCGGVVSALRRTFVYPFSVDEASKPENPTILNLEKALSFLDEIVVPEDFLSFVKNGVYPCSIFDCFKLKENLYRLVDESGRLLAVIERKDKSYSYKAVFI